MKTFCGTTKLHTKKLPILWTGQNAEHIHHNHVADPVHRPLHVEIQKGLQVADNFLVSGRTYVGIAEYPAYTLRIVWYKIGTLAEVKTATKHKSTGVSLLKGKSVGADRNKKLSQRVFISWEDLSASEKDWVLNDAGIDPNRYISILNKFYNRRKRKTA